MPKKPHLKVQICNINLWIENDLPPPPLELFRKFIRFGVRIRPLVTKDYNVYKEDEDLNLADLILEPQCLIPTPSLKLCGEKVVAPDILLLVIQ